MAKNVAFLLSALAIISSLLLVHSAWAVRDPHNDEDLVMGWLGSDHVPPIVHVSGSRERYMEVLDAEARIFLWHGFLTPDEANHIKKVAQKSLSRSGVVDTKSGGSEISDIRTSFGTFLDRGQDEVVKKIEDRIAGWTLLPAGNGEGLQVLRYTTGQKYDAHWDYFFDKNGVSNGGNRYATVLMYLSDVEEGGETVFPNIPAPGGENPPSYSECARKHLAAKPRIGDAILFHSIKPSGALEKRSLHTACPVIKGEKWSAAKWIHVAHYAMGGEAMQRVEQTINPTGTIGAGACEDQNDMCESWAAAGECETNAMYMIGSRGRPGQCVKSCNACSIMTSGTELGHN